MKYTSLLSIVLLLAAFPVYAQFDVVGGPDLAIELSPEHPSANQTVRARLSSTLLDLSESQITWYTNGVITEHGVGRTETSFSSGALGRITEINAAATGVSGSASASVTIRPAELDLLWEADSYTPPFFRGRVLPASGSRVRLQAMPRFQQGDGSLVPTSEIVFTWRKNNAALQSLSGRGKSSIVFDTSIFSDTDTISVTAASGSFSASASATLPTTEPLLTLYEEHPLFGTMYHRAFSARSSVAEEKMSFAAIPYFVPSSVSSLTFDWMVNGGSVQNDPAKPNKLTINAAGSNGVALIELALSHTSNLFLNTSNSWEVLFSAAAQGGSSPTGSDPFRGLSQ